jgi:hypothetical protein
MTPRETGMLLDELEATFDGLADAEQAGRPLILDADGRVIVSQAAVAPRTAPRRKQRVLAALWHRVTRNPSGGPSR